MDHGHSNGGGRGGVGERDQGSLIAKEAFSLAWREIRIYEDEGENAFLGRKPCEPRPRGRKAWRQEVQFGWSIMEEEAVRL